MIFASNIKSSVTVDMPNKTCILSLQAISGPLTTFEYKDQEKSIVFNKRESLSQTKEDLTNYLSHFVKFNQAIIDNFNPESSMNELTWGKIQVNFDNDAKSFGFKFIKDNKTVLDIKGILETKTFTIDKRNQEVNLTFHEWDYYLRSFRLFVRRVPF